MNLSRFISFMKNSEIIIAVYGYVWVRKDAVCVNAPGSFTRGNLDGKLFIVEFFIEFRFTNTSLAVFQGEGHRMVMDFQDISTALEDQVAQGNIPLFGTS